MFSVKGSMTSTERWGAITGIKHLTGENYKYRIHVNLTEALSLLAGRRDHSEHIFLLQGQIAWARVERPQISPVSNEKGKVWHKLVVVVHFFEYNILINLVEFSQVNTLIPTLWITKDVSSEAELDLLFSEVCSHTSSLLTLTFSQKSICVRL